MIKLRPLENFVLSYLVYFLLLSGPFMLLHESWGLASIGSQVLVAYLLAQLTRATETKIFSSDDPETLRAQVIETIKEIGYEVQFENGDIALIRLPRKIAGWPCPRLLSWQTYVRFEESSIVIQGPSIVVLDLLEALCKYGKPAASSSEIIKSLEPNLAGILMILLCLVALLTTFWGDWQVDEGLAWSPDSTQLAFSSRRFGKDRIYILDTDSQNLRCLTKFGPGGEWPVWSPDGTEIAAVYKKSLCIFRKDDGQNTCFDNTQALSAPPAWSPDGNRIAFQARSTNGAGMFVVDRDGDNLHHVHMAFMSEGSSYRYSLCAPVWTEDGNRLIFQANLHKGRGTYAIDLSGENLDFLTVSNKCPGETMIVGEDVNLDFTRERLYVSLDGREAAFVSDEVQNAIFLVSADQSKVRRLPSHSWWERNYLLFMLFR